MRGPSSWLETHFNLTRRQALALLGILVGAFILRAIWLVTHIPQVMSYDEIGYVRMAQQLIDRGVYGYYSTSPNAFTTPGYPWFVAGVFRLAETFSHSSAGALAALRSAQVVLGTITVGLVFALGRKVADARVGLAAALLAAVYPTSLLAQGRVLTETLFTTLLLGWLLAALVLRERRTLGWHVLVGALLAVTVLVRPTVLPLAVVLYALDLFENRDMRFVYGGLVALLAFSLVMSPWWVRNRVVLGKTVLLATQTGDPFLRGTDPYDVYDHVGPSIWIGVTPQTETRVGIARVEAGLRSDPVLWISWFTVGKWWYLWGQPWFDSLAVSRWLHYVFVLGLGWLGTVWGLFERRLRLLAWTVVTMTAAQLAFIPIARYMYPLSQVAIVLGIAFGAYVAVRLKLLPRSEDAELSTH